jgi:hypothetical protein
MKKPAVSAFDIPHCRKDWTGEGWLVMHPHNDAILAYCSSEEAAWAVAKIIEQAMEAVNSLSLRSASTAGM